jgi:quercetin dioxygenase-like cupin family protein
MPISTAAEPPATNHRPRTLDVLGARITIQVTSGETSNQFAVIELSIPPRFSGAPLHYHNHMPEYFFFLSGTVDLFLHDTWHPVTSGNNMIIPPGIVHGYRNTTDFPARFLIVAPGHDNFFFELMDWIRREPVWPPADRNALIDFGLRHDVIYV